MRDFAGLYGTILSPDTLAHCDALTRVDDDEFRMPGDLWVRLVYEYAVAYHVRRPNPAHLLATLTPLYLARTASWVREAAAYGAPEVEAALDALCLRFEALKPAFLAAWHEGRFRT